ncbi:hypothetical protein OCH239_01655 [Roseivivax halodurans JCM 10272]|uniref:Yip1 domain-containing protein n=1 Tax=Roseivivax halodurans JCM 10272 TaxID=1449350 RepID=X7ELC4_9RHOB|nr:hypothetical protein [Roseivivax halodurans]ETX16732.1 hypothetical protein OCH239_01655 [Roseivivax halodurans JCM 10272]
MTLNGFLSLAWQSVTAPRDVARLLLSLRLGTEVVLTAFALVVVLQTIFVALSAQIMPPDPAVASILSQPIVFLAILSTVLCVMILALTFAGRGLGGVAQVRDVGVLIVWVQGLDVLVQAVLVVTAPLLPGLAAMISLLATGVGLWILINFLAEAQGFEGVGKAALSVLLAVTGLALGASLFLSLTGATTGIVPNV